MTERRRNVLGRSEGQLSIGPSQLRWDGGGLTIEFDEITAPLPIRLRGTVRLTPSAVLGQTYDLDGRGRHLWRPISPRAEVEVTMSHPPVRWRGAGYFDTNSGSEPLEQGFSNWTWSRAHLPRETRLYYDITRKNGERRGLALALGANGEVRTTNPRDLVALPATLWRVPRLARPLADVSPSLVRTLEDTPFYSRSLLRDRHDGETAQIIHESLSADRLRSPLVRAMLPFRMPRAFW
jgi:carotenoid 1,2-hydratase